jgi:hypothetical protein
MVDWAMCGGSTYRAYKTLTRGTAGGALGGVTSDFVMNVPFADGRQRTVLTYEGTPLFRNDFITSTETDLGASLTTGGFTSLWCGTFDDGSRRVGLAGIYPAASPLGITVQPVGQMEAQDTGIWRVKWYANIALYNRRGLARLTNLTG